MRGCSTRATRPNWCMATATRSITTTWFKRSAGRKGETDGRERLRSLALVIGVYPAARDGKPVRLPIELCCRPSRARNSLYRIMYTSRRSLPKGGKSRWFV
jgi:hypothetical protein